MLVNNPIPAGGYRHNYVRLGFLLGAILLFIAHITLQQIYERDHYHDHGNRTNNTLHAQGRVINEITPSYWVHRSLNALNYFWQLAWLLYSLTFIYRRSSTGYLYLSPNTLTPTFYIIYSAAFVIQSIWLVFFEGSYFAWTWIVYLISFLLLSLALFIINNNLSINKKLYETEGFSRDVWCLRFFAQNGVAFFACWTAIRYVLAFDVFLQVRLGLSMVNSGTVALLLAGIIAAFFFFGSNFNAALVDQCAYQFSPWLVFIIFFWGVVENNWTSKDIRRNNVIAAIELVATVAAAVAALALFTIRYRSSKIDTIA